MLLRDIERAAGRLKGVIHETPLCSSRTFSKMAGANVYLKCENLQKTGSFKVRGAYNKIAAMQGDACTVIASSAGNHAQGVAYAAAARGWRALIVMPRATSIAKVSATEGYGANVVLHGDCYEEAYEHALRLQEECGALFVHPFDDEDVIAGQGTISLEVLRELPTVDAVLIPAGGGGLLAGMAACIKQINPRVQVIGVQARGADAIARAFDGAGEEAPTARTIADGIAVSRPGKKTTALIRRYVDAIATVTDDEIADAILLLLERNKMLVEPAGAASLAAALSGRLGIAGQRVACVLSGGNIDAGFIHRIVERGLVTRGRQMKFQTVMADVPGSLEKFSSVVAACGANIILVQHDRLRSDLELGEAVLHIACEVSSRAHGEQLVGSLKESGYRVRMES